MTVNNELDINTLNWVKSEIDETMEQARTSLESYIEDQQDESLILFCINYLHQVYGTLQMVELYGASLLAEELELLAKAIHSNHVKNKDESFEVLIRGSLQLPDYLEKLQTGQKDTPIVLLPLFNDMRAARSEALLSETALFNPDLSVEPPAPKAKLHKDGEITKQIAELAKEKRHQFHIGLLGWFNKKNEKKSLGLISNVLEDLRNVSEEQNTNRMLWVADGLIDSLKHKGVDASVAVKSLVGKVDRTIKKIIDGGEVALAMEPPTDLVKNLLYYVAGSSATAGKTKQVKDLFKLAEVMPDTQTLEKARADLNAPNVALMDTVSGVLKEDLLQVKDSLDVFMRSEDKNPEILKLVSEKLTSMADTLGMLSLGPQRKDLIKQVEFIDSIIDGKHKANDDELMEIAAAIIGIEHTLNSMGEVTQRPVDGAASSDSSSSIKQPKTAEQQELLESVVAEAKIDIAAVKESVTDFSRQLNHPEVLSSVPALLDKVRGSLNILQLDRAAELLLSCKGYVENKLIPSKTIPEPETLDYLADAISSIEYYMESLVDSWGEPTAILNVAATSLEQLGKVLDEDKPTVRDPNASQDLINIDADTLVEATDDTVINLAAPSEVDVAATNESVDATITDLAQPDFGEPDTVTDLSQPDLDVTAEDLEFDLAFTPEVTESDLKSTDTEQITSLEIEGTLELDLADSSDSESSQEIERLDEAMGLWFSDPLSSDVAGLLVEVIKSIEENFKGDNKETVLKITNDMKQTIQRVADNSEVFSDDIEKSLLWARDELLKHVTGMSVVDGNSEAIDLSLEVKEKNITEAPTEFSIPEQVSAAQNKSQENESKTFSPPIEIDEEIFEIFLEEAEEEYENISRLLPLWKSNLGDMEALKDMRRSFHTLKGSGRLVGANDLGEFAWAFESMLNRVLDKTIQPTAELLDLMERGRAALPVLYELLKSSKRPDQNIFSLMEHADSLSRGELFTPLTETISSVSIPQPDLSVLDTPSMDSLSQPIDESLDKIQRPEIDSVLLEIYRKEVATHLQVLKQYITDWHENDIHEVTEPLFRALHTLTGSARTTGVQVVSELCLQLERYIKLLQSEELLVSNEGIKLFEDSANRIELICAQLGESGNELYVTTDLVHRIETLINTLRESMATRHSDGENKADDIGMVEPSLNSISSSIELEMPDDYDEELLEIFIEEGTEILDESENTLHAWIKDPDNNEYIEALQRQLHTLKGGARMSGVTVIGDVSHQLESLVTDIVANGTAMSDDIFAVIQHTQDSLVTMLEQLKAHQPLSSGQAIIDEIGIQRAKNRSSDSGEVAEPKANENINSETTSNNDMEISIENLEINELDQNSLAIEIGSEADAVVESKDINDLSIELTEELTSLADELDDIQLTDIDVSEDLSLSQNDLSENSLDLENDGENTEVIEQPVFDEPDAGLPPSSMETSIEPVEDNSLSSLDVDTEAAPQKTAPAEQVRVRADTLNNLVNFAGEVSIYRSRLEQQVNSFRFNLQELDETVDRFRGQLRKFEIETEAQIQTRKEEKLSAEHEHFDPLEFDRFTQMQQISRSMLESMNDIDSLRSILSGLNRESETLLVQQSRVNTELQEGLMSTRLVPFAKQVNRLKRIVRQTCKELGKQADIGFDGADLELDRNIVERMMPPIEHMLRNAIAHGIEMPAQRKAAGKPEQGTIHFDMSREGGDVVIQITDDGAGIDFNAIRSKAIETGVIKEGARVSEKFLLDLILESGFSTAEEVTQIAGRGVGLDVVNNEIKQLGGVLNIDTTYGEGTRFTISMPLSLAVSRALMVYVGDNMYAVPLLSVEGVERISHEALLELQSKEHATYTWVEEEFHYIHLGHLMDGVNLSLPGEGNKAALLMVRSGNFRAALHIEGLVGSREIVIKPVGAQLSTLRGISGATIMGDGSVVLILDLGVLIRIALTEDEQNYLETEVQADVAEPVIEEEKMQTVMVVDDSITVRKVTSRFLERNELEVIQAKDGVDALTQLLDVIPDVMLLDVEMPRMDGFELAINMRNDERLKDIPIIMITSRTGQKHRDRAMSIGVNMYMGKPYNETELLENIHSLLNIDK
ncbi:Signal transduction histidine kinase CheA [hydrothermal vent metagenome]|uniref:histidine kinase n=1 Tax=hydrothermal vent metagenome TaxID=652676 RepID=A0A3B1A3S8_9ZZZZ